MTMGPFETRKNVALTGGEILYRDSSITETTVSVIDAGFDAQWSGGLKGSYPDGSRLKNICYVNDYAESKVSSWASVPTGGGGGMIYNGGAKGLKLPTSFYPGDSRDFIITMWIKFPADGIVSKVQQNLMMFIGNGDGNTNSASLFRLYAVMDAAFKIQGFGVVLFGTLQTVPAAVLNAVTLGNVTQISVRVTYNKVSNKWLPTFYINGKPIATGNEVGAAYTAYPDQAWVMGHQPSGFSLISTFYRARLDVLSNSVLKADEIIQTDYLKNREYFI